MSIMGLLLVASLYREQHFLGDPAELVERSEIHFHGPKRDF
jgi:hypothetical protein